MHLNFQDDLSQQRVSASQILSLNDEQLREMSSSDQNNDFSSGDGALYCIKLSAQNVSNPDNTLSTTYPALYQAIVNRSLDEVVWLLQNGVDVNQRYQDRDYPLEEAIETVNLAMIQALLEAGADPNLGLYPPLYKAVIHNHVGIASILLQAGADPNVRLAEGKTLLMEASENGCFEVAKLLVEAGADTKAVSERDDTALLIAATNGSKEIFDYLAPKCKACDRKAAKQLLQTRNQLVRGFFEAVERADAEAVQEAIVAGTDVDVLDEGGSPALQRAAEYGYLNIVKLLLSKGADPDYSGETLRETPLISAARQYRLAEAFVLLKAGADPNKNSQDGIFTPLLIASLTPTDSPSLVKDLLAAGVEINQQNRFNSTALMAAAYVKGLRQAPWHSSKIVQTLLEAGASEDGIEKMPLIIAAERGDIKAVEELIENRANVNAINYYGATGLIESAKKGHLEVMRLLIEAGADVNITSTTSALICAISWSNVDMVRLLLDADADIHAKTIYGETALAHLQHASREIRKLFSGKARERKVR